MADESGEKNMARWGRAAAAGGQMVVVFLVAFFGGRWADSTWHTRPVFTVIGIFVGFGVGLLSAYRMLARP